MKRNFHIFAAVILCAALIIPSVLADEKKDNSGAAIAEVKGYRHADHKPVPEAFAAAEAGDTFLVDYVRVFDEVR